jgi:hypothetical protein
MVATSIKQHVPRSYDLLIVKELLQKLVKRHFKHLRRHFYLVDYQTLALVAETEHRNRVIIVF